MTDEEMQPPKFLRSFANEDSNSGVFRSSLRTLKSQDEDHCTPILLYPTANETPPAAQKRVTFADAMEQLKSLSITEEQRPTTDQYIPNVPKNNNKAIESPTSMHDRKNNIAVEERRYVAHTSANNLVSGDHQYMNVNECNTVCRSEPDGLVEICENDRDEEQSERLSTGGFNRSYSSMKRLPPFDSTEMLDTRRRQTICCKRSVATTYGDFGQSGYSHCTRFGTIPERRDNHKHMIHSPPTARIVSPPAAFMNPPSRLQQRRSFCPSIHYDEDPSLNNLGQAKYTNGVHIYGGEDNDSDYVDMSSNCGSPLEDLNMKMKQLIDSMDEQRKRIDTMQRLLEEDKRQKDVNYENTYKSFADDVYYKKVDTTDVKEVDGNQTKTEMKKIKRKLLLSCV